MHTLVLDAANLAGALADPDIGFVIVVENQPMRSQRMMNRTTTCTLLDYSMPRLPLGRSSSEAMMLLAELRAPLQMSFQSPPVLGP